MPRVLDCRFRLRQTEDKSIGKYYDGTVFADILRFSDRLLVPSGWNGTIFLPLSNYWNDENIFENFFELEIIQENN